MPWRRTWMPQALRTCTFRVSGRIVTCLSIWTKQNSSATLRALTISARQMKQPRKIRCDCRATRQETYAPESGFALFQDYRLEILPSDRNSARLSARNDWNFLKLDAQ